MDISTIRRIWDELHAKLDPEIRTDLPTSSGITVRLYAARSQRGQIKYYNVPQLAISTFFYKGDCPDLRITILHEMAHLQVYRSIGDRGHGPIWKRTYRWYLNQGGFPKHPATRTHTDSEGATSPTPTPLRGRFRYYCECPSRTLADGGYGLRTRRSLDGRTCGRCHTRLGLHIER